MKETSFVVEDLVALEACVSEVVDVLDGPAVVLLQGDLGAGKTTLVQHICAHLGVEEAVTSPTFSLIQEYQTPSEESIYHIDLYRLNSPSDFSEIGLSEILESGKWVFVEWPELAAGILPEEYRTVSIKSSSSQQRKIVISS